MGRHIFVFEVHWAGSCEAANIMICYFGILLQNCTAKVLYFVTLLSKYFVISSSRKNSMVKVAIFVNKLLDKLRKFIPRALASS